MNVKYKPDRKYCMKLTAYGRTKMAKSVYTNNLEIFLRMIDKAFKSRREMVAYIFNSKTGKDILFIRNKSQ
jgi:hypothetical protein